MDLLRLKGFEPIYVIGHSNIDIDSGVSSKIMSDILNDIGIKAYYAVLEDKYELKEVAGMKFVVNKSGAIQSDDGPYKDNGDELFGGAKFTYNTDTKGVSYKSIASMTE